MPLDHIQNIQAIESDLRAWSVLTAFRLLQALKPTDTHEMTDASPFPELHQEANSFGPAKAQGQELGNTQTKSLEEFSSK